MKFVTVVSATCAVGNIFIPLKFKVDPVVTGSPTGVPETKPLDSKLLVWIIDLEFRLILFCTPP